MYGAEEQYLIETEAYFCTGFRSCGWDRSTYVESIKQTSVPYNDPWFQKSGKSQQLEHECICILRRGT